MGATPETGVPAEVVSDAEVLQPRPSTGFLSGDSAAPKRAVGATVPDMATAPFPTMTTAVPATAETGMNPAALVVVSIIVVVLLCCCMLGCCCMKELCGCLLGGAEDALDGDGQFGNPAMAEAALAGAAGGYELAPKY